MRRLGLTLALSVALAAGVAAPAAARTAITVNLHLAGCFATFTATWTGIPGRARTYELVYVSDGVPGEPPLLSRTSTRNGSISTPNISFEGGGFLSGRITFYDAAGRVVRTADNVEGPIPIDCH